MISQFVAIIPTTLGGKLTLQLAKESGHDKLTSLLI
jgi:hypothetical protein